MMQPEAMAGQIVEGHYRIIKPVGYGGMATVFLAEDFLLRREVAMKVFSPMARNSADFVSYFVREARVLAQLDHPHILPVYDYGEQGGLLYLVMPYVAKGSLKDLLKVRPVLSTTEAVRLITPILSALQYAHQRGLVHRDIKPANMLFKTEDTLLLSDFGLVKISSAADGVPMVIDITATRQSNLAMAGTPEYMAPEQARGEATILSDIYSIGVVLYEMLTGTRPFVAENVLGVLVKHLYERPRPPYEINPRIPSQVQAVVLRALEKDVTRRYQQPIDFLQAFTLASNAGETASTIDISTIPTSSLDTPATPSVLNTPAPAFYSNAEKQDPEANVATVILTSQTPRARFYSSLGITALLLALAALLISPSLFMLIPGQATYHKNQPPPVQKLVLHKGSYTGVPVTPTSLDTCPAAGTLQTPVMPALSQGKHPSIVYVANQGPDYMPTLGALIRYDVTTGNQTELVKFANTHISDAQISQDRQWLLFFITVPVQNFIDRQSKIQIIRIDGQHLQTLYCSDTRHSITRVLWSPDQKRVIFGTLDNTMGDIPPDTRLLNLVSGDVQKMLPIAYLSPVKWLDDTRLYLHTGGFEGHPEDLLILDTSLGPNQQQANLVKAYISPDKNPQWSADIGPDGSQLFVSQYANQNYFGGPSTLGKQPATGGMLIPFFSNANLAILSIQVISSRTLLLLSKYPKYPFSKIPVTTQYGLWKINSDGTGLAQLTVDKDGGQLLNQSTQLPWSNVSRDGSMYALEDTVFSQTSSDITHSTLLIGLLAGGTALPFASTSNDSELEIAGWTTF